MRPWMKHLQNPFFIALVFVAFLLVIYNYYPFNASPPYSETLLMSDPLAIKLYLFSTSLYVFAGILFIFLMPLFYVKWRVPRVRYGYRLLLAIFGLGLLGFVLLNITYLPAWVSPSLELIYSVQFLAPLGAAASTIYAFLIEDVLHGLLLIAFVLTGYYGGKIGLRLLVGVPRIAEYFIALLLIDVVAYYVIALPINLLIMQSGCYVCIYPYFRGWHPEVLRAVNVSLLTGRDVSFASLFTWGDLASRILCGLIDGMVLVRFLKGEIPQVATES